MADKLAALKTVYKRQLPVDLISFSSSQGNNFNAYLLPLGKRIFKESLC
jgi:hypothetical protein